MKNREKMVLVNEIVMMVEFLEDAVSNADEDEVVILDKDLIALHRFLAEVTGYEETLK